MKKLYIVLTFTGTNLSKFIKFFTHDEFAHVSISLDKNLDNMYSFGRLNPDNAWIGGFVQENPKYDTFKKFEKTTYSNIYSLEVSDKEYNDIIKVINYFKDNKDVYRFNRTGMILSRFGIKLKRKKRFYCAEFCKHLLDSAYIKTNLPDPVRPEEFKNIKNIKLIYKGMLKDYLVEE